MTSAIPAARSQAASRALAVAVAGLGALVLLGWAFDVTVLKAVIPGLATMKPNTALCFVLGGVGLGLKAERRGGVAGERIATVCGALVLGIGLTTLVEYLLVVNLGVDSLLVHVSPQPGAPHPVRMSEMTALSFACSGGALLLLDAGRGRTASGIMALVSGLVALTALVGYAYGVRALYAIDPFSSVALHTALGFAALAIGVLCARPDRGLVAVTIGNTAGGAMARRLLPLALFLPLTLGWVTLQGERMGLYAASFAVGAHAVSIVVILTGAILWCGTSLNQFDAERRRVALELKRSNEELERFAYVASHDLQEPLRMIRNYVELLGRRYRGKLDADADDFIGFAQDGATRMQRLIEDLLSYSRVNTRGAELQPTDATVALTRALANLHLVIAETGATITHDALPVLPADSSQLEHVFQNLIGNALKFRGADPPVIHVAMAQRDGEAVFDVRDNGIGIDPQYFDRIFVIFQRLHGREQYPGTGLGLAITKRIIERHGGRIWVESQPGQGSTFFFALPATGDSA